MDLDGAQAQKGEHHGKDKPGSAFASLWSHVKPKVGREWIVKVAVNIP